MPSFPILAGEGWTVTYRPIFTTGVAAHVSGRETRAGRDAHPLWEITLGFDVLSDALHRDIETLAGFHAAQGGAALPFWINVPADLGQGATMPCRFAADQIDEDEFVATLIAVRTLALRSVKV